MTLRIKGSSILDPFDDKKFSLKLNLGSDQGSKQSLASSPADVKAGQSEPFVTSLSLSRNAKLLYETAADATGEITKLRQEQLTYAKEAEAIADPVRQNNLNTFISNLSTEISRISSAATFNGTSVLQGVSTTINQSDSSIQTAISLNNVSAIASAVSVSVTSPSNAATAVDTLEATFAAAINYSGGAASAASKAESVYASTPAGPSGPEADSGTPTSFEDAEKLLGKIVNEINSAISTGASTDALLVNNLDSNRVSDLLTE